MKAPLIFKVIGMLLGLQFSKKRTRFGKPPLSSVGRPGLSPVAAIKLNVVSVAICNQLLCEPLVMLVVLLGSSSVANGLLICKTGCQFPSSSGTNQGMRNV
jgi:hypothetical protein